MYMGKIYYIYCDFPEQKEKEAKSIRKKLALGVLFFNFVGEILGY